MNQRFTLGERLKFNEPVSRKESAPPKRGRERSINTWIADLLDKPEKTRAASLYELVLRLNLNASHLDEAREAYVRRLGLR